MIWCRPMAKLTSIQATITQIDDEARSITEIDLDADNLQEWERVKEIIDDCFKEPNLSDLVEKEEYTNE